MLQLKFMIYVMHVMLYKVEWAIRALGNYLMHDFAKERWHGIFEFMCTAAGGIFFVMMFVSDTPSSRETEMPASRLFAISSAIFLIPLVVWYSFYFTRKIIKFYQVRIVEFQETGRIKSFSSLPLSDEVSREIDEDPINEIDEDSIREKPKRFNVN
jgi:hypothetical protein